MKIECPECKLAGTVDDGLVPATGIAMNCPRCKARFTVDRPEAGSEHACAMLDSCPSCQYATFTDEKFSACPKCGLVVEDYQRQMLTARGNARGGKKSPAAQSAMTPEQQRRDEESRRKHGLGEPEVNGSGENGVGGMTQVPLSLLVAGWLTIAAAAALLIYGASGFMEYLAKLREAEAAVQAGETTPSGVALFWRFAIVPLLMIGYAASMAVVASRFLALRTWTIRWLEIGGWTGMGLGVLTELVDLVAWCSRASENATIGYYATGLLGGALMALLWMFPPFVLVEYMRSEQFDRLSDYFS